MRHYRSILKKRNKLYTEYKILSSKLICVPYDKFIKLYERRKKVFNEFKLYQRYLESIDNEKH